MAKTSTNSEESLTKEITKLNAQLTAILKPYKKIPDFDLARKSTTCEIKWKSTGGDKCHIGLAIWEEDGRFIAFCIGSDDDDNPIEPSVALAWLKGELAIYGHQIPVN